MNPIEQFRPMDHIAERSIIGSVLLNEACMDDVTPIVTPEMFTDQRYQLLYAVMLDMRNRNKRIDVVTLCKEARKKKEFDAVFPKNLEADISEAAREVPHAAFARDYARIVRDFAIQRSAMKAGDSIIKIANERDFVSDDALAEFEKLIHALRDEHRIGFDGVRHISEILTECIARIDKRQRGELLGTKTGLTDLDKIMRLREGELIVLAARPGMGKTALALNIAEHVANDQEVLIFSLEMDAESLAERLLSGQCRIKATHMRDGTMSHDERTAVLDQAGEIANLNNIIIDDTSTRNVWDIAAVARRTAKKSKLGLIVIDYLQLLSATDRKVPRQEQVASMTRSLKQLARETKTPILCLAQLNRKTEDEKGNRPKLSHLRESGAIEQDADIVLFIHREGYYKPDAPEGEAEILIAKHRNGSTGMVKVAWQSEFTRFENLATAIQSAMYDPGFEDF